MSTPPYYPAVRLWSFTPYLFHTTRYYDATSEVSTVHQTRCPPVVAENPRRLSPL